jgi:hypothetical protein
MTTIRKFARGILLLTAVLTLAACGPSVEPEPTPDADMIRTAAVMTVEAELTQQALMNPTPTQTNTPEPTATSDIPTLMPLSLETQTTDAGAALPGKQALLRQLLPPVQVHRIRLNGFPIHPRTAAYCSRVKNLRSNGS